MREPERNVPELGRFRVGEWSVRQDEGTLAQGERTVRVEPRVMDVLVYLAAAPDRVVSREELLEAVWGGSFVEEGALAQAVHSLRKALGDDARQPRYVQTLHRRGYRLLAPVVVGPAEAVEESPVTAVLPEPDPEPSPRPLPAASPAHRWQARRVLVALGLLAVVALWIAWSRTSLVRDRAAGSRVVVLPFASTGEPDGDLFAAGLSDEITKDLSLTSLKVIARRSALHFAGKRLSPREAGRELGVDHVVAGTVRWERQTPGPARVQVAVELVRTEDGARLWHDRFEREAGDVFDLQTEISQRVLDALGVPLRPEEERSLSRPPTENQEAYRAYLRGLDLKNQPFYSEEHVRQALPMFERAVEIDPGFADAWAELSQTHSYLAFNSDRSPARVEKARAALERALALAPDSLPVRLAKAYYTYRCQEDFDSALRQLEDTRKLYPNDSDVLQTLAFVLRRQGRLAEALELLQRARSLDPQAVKLVWTLGETQRALRNYEQADRFFAQAISLAPDQAPYWQDRALNHLAWTGEIEDARAILRDAPVADDPKLIPVAFTLDFYARDYAHALARLDRAKVASLTLAQQSWLAVQAAAARERMGDHRGALAAAEAARAELEARVALYPNETFFRAYLGVVLAQLGRSQEALARAQQAVDQRRNDAFSGPRMEAFQALTEAALGRRAEAVARLARLKGTAYQAAISTAELRLDPLWDPLRGDPGFEELLRRND